MFLRTALSTLVAGAMALGSAGAARAATACDATNGSVTFPNAAGTGNFTGTPIYISGSSAVEPMLKIIGAKMASESTNPHVIVYIKDGSCAGVARIAGNGQIAAGTTMYYVPPDLAPTATTPTCTLGAAQVGDLVLADADATLCPGVSAQPTNTKDFSGPANNMVLVVPSQSSQTAISAEDVYLIFGLGAMGSVMPWIDPLSYYIRTPDSGTRAMIAANAGLGSATWQGQTAANGANYSSGTLYNAVVAAGATAAEKTIGILGSDYLDVGTNRAKVKSLAFRAFGQHYAYWPDSTVTSYDKKNVREGRYAIWGFLHMLASVATGSTTPMSASAQYFVNVMQGTQTPAPSFNVNDAITDSHYVPQCAMKVTHAIEGGDLQSYSPDAPCGCYFDSRIAGKAATGCTACTADTDCGSAGGHCRFGYCEAK